MKAIITLTDKKDGGFDLDLEFDPPMKISDAEQSESAAAILAVGCLNFIVSRIDKTGDGLDE